MTNYLAAGLVLSPAAIISLQPEENTNTAKIENRSGALTENVTEANAYAQQLMIPFLILASRLLCLFYLCYEDSEAYTHLHNKEAPRQPYGH